MGPALTALGFVLLGGGGGPYSALVLPMIVLGFGMTITVAPLTTTVLNAVPEHQTGVASGINNAVASVGSLLLVAVLGTVALGSFNHSLDRHLADSRASPAVTEVVQAARGGSAAFTMPKAERTARASLRAAPPA